jgi:hypothetical protein
MNESFERDVAAVCESFQLDLSCLVDGELDEAAAARAMLHLEGCDECRAFFQDTRNCVQLHLDMADPDRLLARLSTLTGRDIASEAKGIELVHRLATILYQLGKAYVLAGTNPGSTQRVFDAAAPVEPTQTRGRGFVDGVLMSGQEARWRRGAGCSRRRSPWTPRTRRRSSTWASSTPTRAARCRPSSATGACSTPPST